MQRSTTEFSPGTGFSLRVEVAYGLRVSDGWERRRSVDTERPSAEPILRLAPHQINRTGSALGGSPYAEGRSREDGLSGLDVFARFGFTPIAGCVVF